MQKHDGNWSCVYLRILDCSGVQDTQQMSVCDLNKLLEDCSCAFDFVVVAVIVYFFEAGAYVAVLELTIYN